MDVPPCFRCEALQREARRLGAELANAREQTERTQAMREALALASLESQAVSEAFERFLRQIQRTIASGLDPPRA